MRKLREIEWAIIILGVIGIISLVSENPSRFIMPIIVLGTIFLLYKFPPHRWGSGNKRRRKRRSKKTHLYVIQGKKKDDDEPPRYH